MTGSATGFSATSRRALLDEFFAVNARIDATPTDGEPEAGDLARYGELRRAYRERLPMLPVARCPFTKAVYVHSLDPFGIDGPWWDYRSTNRPLEMLTGTVLAFTGALRMASRIERAPFLVRPGPGAPFVVPRLLQRDGVRAVISSLPIGAHTGYIVTYFADPAPDDLEGFNDWGTDFYQFEYDTDQLGWCQASATAADHDFDLAPYLRSGQLLWIAPGDETMTLREGVEGCPYVDAEGCRVPQLVQDGERWLGEFPWDEDNETTSEDALEASSSKPSSAPVNETVPPTTLEPVPPSTAKSAMPPASTADMAASSDPPVAPPATSAGSCASCGATLKPTSKFCPSCGKPVLAAPTRSAPATSAPPSNVCVHCGQPRRPGAKFCRSCGKP